MFFDATLQAFTMDVIPLNDDHHIIQQFQVGVVLPGPQGQKGLLPVGAIKVPTGYHMAKEYAEEILAALEGMEPPSKLITASDMGQAEQVADLDRQIRSGA